MDVLVGTLCNHVGFEMSHTNHMAPYDVATMYQCDYDCLQITKIAKNKTFMHSLN